MAAVDKAGDKLAALCAGSGEDHTCSAMITPMTIKPNTQAAT